MKKYCLISAFLLLGFLTALCQTNSNTLPSYDYAMLRIIDDDNSYIVEYSNTGQEVRLKDTLKIDRNVDNFTEARFKCFNYLNAQGYELIFGTCNSLAEYKMVPVAKYEYLFKRSKR